MASPRKICVVTGTRAEYGLLFWLMKEIDADPALTLQLIVTGTHLEARFGNTVEVIERDGFKVDARVALDLADDAPVTVARASGTAVAGIAAALDDLKPEIVVVLGDRFEILAAAQAAMLTRTPIAHIHGGEATEGLIDEAIRHAITKMAHLHFPSAEPYRTRIIQMGEDPARVFTVGAPGLDNIEREKLLERDALSDAVGLDLSGDYFLVTYHPVTLSEDDPARAINALLAALDDNPAHKVIFTGVNADPGNAAIADAVHTYVTNNRNRARAVTSLGQVRYLSAMKHCACVIGNSSSGLIEAPSMHVPTVNVGARQRGRLRAASVIDCDDGAEDIKAAIAKAVSSDHMALTRNVINPYGAPGASVLIKDHLADADLDGILMKRFHDLQGAA